MGVTLPRDKSHFHWRLGSKLFFQLLVVFGSLYLRPINSWLANWKCLSSVMFSYLISCVLYHVMSCLSTLLYLFIHLFIFIFCCHCKYHRRRGTKWKTSKDFRFVSVSRPKEGRSDNDETSTGRNQTWFGKGKKESNWTGNYEVKIRKWEIRR